MGQATGEEVEQYRRKAVDDAQHAFQKEKDGMTIEMERIRKENKQLLEQLAKPPSEDGTWWGALRVLRMRPARRPNFR